MKGGIAAEARFARARPARCGGTIDAEHAVSSPIAGDHEHGNRAFLGFGEGGTWQPRRIFGSSTAGVRT
jgi:hypothetical protein